MELDYDKFGSTTRSRCCRSTTIWRSFSLMLLVMMTAFLPMNLFAQPANDLCANAITVNVGTQGTCLQTSGTNAGATPHGTSGVYTSCDAVGTNYDVFYSFTAPSTGEVQLTITELSGSVEVAIVEANCANTGTFITYGVCDGSVSATESYVSSGLVAGTTYFVVIWSDSQTGGTFEFCLEEAPLPPPNDLCANAVALTVGANGTCASNMVAGTTLAATDDGALGTCDAVSPNNAVWYSFVAPASGQISYTVTEISGALETGILTACGGTEVDCNTSIIGTESTVVCGLTPGSTYYLYVSDDGTAGDFEVCVEENVAPANDLCVNAQPITVQTAGSCSAGAVQGTNIGSCDDGALGSCDVSGNYAVWYSFVAPASGEVVYSVTELTGTLELAVLTSCGGSSVHCNTSLTGTEVDRVTGLTPGATYYIALSSDLSSATGQFELCLEEYAAPTNDLCSNAVPLTVGASGSCPANRVSGNNIGVTDDGVLGSCDAVVPNYGVWYSFVAPSSGSVAYTVTELSGTLETGILTSCGGTDVNCNTTITGTETTPVTGLTPGATYLIYVSSESTTGQGFFDICVTEFFPPANDSCSVAEPLAVVAPGGCPAGGTTGSNLGAASGELFSCDATGTNYGVWYSFVAPANGEVVLSIVEGTANISDAGILNSCGGTEIYCNSSIGTSLADTIKNLAPGSTYYVAVWSDTETSTGTFTICVEGTNTPVPTCTAPNTSLGTITGSSAEIIYSPTNTGSTIQIEYGTTGFTQGTGTIVSPVSSPYLITGLSSGVSYDVYVMEICSGGDTATTFLTFTTPLTNDDCASATPVTVGAQGVCNLTSGTTVNASPTGSSGVYTSCDATGTNYDVFYSFTAPASGEVQLNITELTGNVEVAIIADSCGNLGSTVFTYGVCDNSILGTESYITSGLVPGATYLVVVWSDSQTGGTFDFCLEESPTAPANDLCVNAVPLTVGAAGSCSSNIVTGTTLAATDDGALGSCDAVAPNYAVWYSFVAPSTGAISYTITEISGTLESGILDACGGIDVECNTSLTGTETAIICGLNPGSTYYFYVSHDATPGDFELCVEAHTPPVNDVCTSAISLTVGASGSCATGAIAGSNVGACDDGVLGSCDASGNYAVWYSFVAPSTGSVLYTVTEISGTLEAGVLDACGGASISCNTGITGTESSVAGGLVPGNTYYLFVSSDAVSGQGTFDVCVEAFTPPANDLCANATNILVSASGGCPAGAVQGSNIGSTDDGAFGTCDNTGTNFGVFHSFVAPSNGEAIVSVTELTGSLEAVILDGCTGAELFCYGTLTATEIDTLTGLTPGNTYIIAVWSDTEAGQGTYEICVEGTVVIAPVVVTCPASVNLAACTDQATIDAQFAAFIAGFSYTGGTGTITETDLTVYMAPSECTGGSVTVNYVVSDGTSSDNCTATFAVAAHAPVAVVCPGNVSLPACTDQASINSQFATWISGFSFSGGCGTTATDLSTFVAPDACLGGVVTVLYTATDNCSSDNCTATFTVAAPAPLTVSCPANVTITGGTQTQANVNSQFATFLAGFSFAGGCGTTATNLAGYTVPNATTGGIVSINYVATDLCGSSAACTATFTVTAAVVCNPPINVTALNITYNSVEVAYNASNLGSTVYMEYGQSGFAQGTGTVMNNVSSPQLITGLMSATSYDVYVCEVCPNGVTSCTMITVVTLPAPNGKVVICHKGKTIEVSVNALQAHLNHGDYIGPCSSAKKAEVVEDHFDVHIYPNPADNNLTVELHEEAVVEIVDITGKVLMVKEGMNLIFDITNLAEGIYLLRITTGDGQYIERFVKQ